MKLSIIVPVYNVEKYLSRCLDSLLRQGLEVGEYEVICVNDGSSDNSVTILEEYQQKYPNIFKVITQEHQGVGYARNTGMKMAKGEYITFVDSDDSVVKEGYAYFFEHFLTKKPEVLSFSCEKLESDTLISDDKPLCGKVIFAGNGRVAYNKKYKYMRTVCLKVFLRSFLIKHGIFFEKILAEDNLFFFEVFRRNPSVVMTDCKIYRYMQDNKDSIMRSDKRERIQCLLDGRLYVIGKLNKYLAEDGWDMMEGLKGLICLWMKLVYESSFRMRYTKKEWKCHMNKIGEMGVNKFLYKKETRTIRKMKVFIISSASHSFLMYLILSFLYTKIYTKRMS